MTSQSVVHCSHDVDPQHTHTHFHDDAHYGDNSQEGVHDDEATIETPNEYTGLLEGERDVRRSMSIIDITYQKLRGKKSIGKCMGYSNIKDCLTNKLDGKGARFSETDAEERESEDEIGHGSGSETVSDLGLDDEGHHHHHVSTRYTHLFSIGLQTALAISVHKIPEGFLTFATSHANPELGFSVFLALSIHNISEGFSIAFPLYLALGKRWLAILASIVLGGLSQPIGGILAWVLFKSKLNTDANLTFGLLVSITAGFLSIIGLQMYGASVTYGEKQSTSLAFAFLGIAIIGFSYCLIAPA
jgi:ZIP family zinc transporter